MDNKQWNFCPIFALNKHLICFVLIRIKTSDFNLAENLFNWIKMDDSKYEPQFRN